MSVRMPRIRVGLPLGSLFFCLRAVLAEPVATDEPTVPSLERVTQTAANYFSALPEYQSGDLINRGQVTELFGQFEQIGWKVPESPSVAERVLADSSFLVRTFSTARGRAFVRKVHRDAGGYNRLDRLSRTNDGKKHIRYLVRQKDGHLLLKYMFTTKGGQKLTRQMARLPGGTDLNKPTNRIYTAEQLLEELAAIYRQQRPSDEPALPNAP